MDIFQFAMEKEKLSEDYYRQLAEKTDHKGLKNIFNMLAGEESKHYKIVEQMSRNIAPKVTETPILGNAKEIFEKMRESAEKFNPSASLRACPELVEGTGLCSAAARRAICAPARFIFSTLSSRPCRAKAYLLAPKVLVRTALLPTDRYER